MKDNVRQLIVALQDIIDEKCLCDVRQGVSSYDDPVLPGCPAAWYAKALCPNLNGYGLWTLGAAELNLHFNLDVCTWAHRNPHIWGNRYGRSMFHDSRAYGTESSVFPADFIIRQWEGVLKRWLD